MDLQGDSAALRTQGAALRSAADDVTDIARNVEHRLEEMQFRGPAADRFRAQMDERLTRLRHVSQELDDLAGLVNQSAQSA
jgi:Proteins of 100 residues with WXG